MWNVKKRDATNDDVDHPKRRMKFYESRDSHLLELQSTKFVPGSDGNMMKVVQDKENEEPQLPDAIFDSVTRNYRPPKCKLRRRQRALREQAQHSISGTPHPEPFPASSTSLLPIETISSSYSPPIQSNTNEAATDLSMKILELVLGPECPVKTHPAPEVKEVLEEYEKAGKVLKVDPLRLLARDIIEMWMPGAWDYIISCGERNSLPRFEEGDNSVGLYIDELLVKLLESITEHKKLYGGMTAATEGFMERITNHRSPAFRQRHKSLHYTYSGLPTTKSTFYVFAKYPRPARTGKILLGECVMIASLGLYEHQRLYAALAKIGVPMCQKGVHTPVVGLNREIGLRYGTWSHAEAAEARNKLLQKRLTALITTGFPVSIGKQKNGSGKFGLARSLEVFIDRRYAQQNHPYGAAPGLSSVMAVAFIHLSPGKTHDNAYYQWDEDHSEVQQWGLWISMSDGSGFWVEESRANLSVNQKRFIQSRQERSLETAQTISEEYGLIARATA